LKARHDAGEARKSAAAELMSTHSLASQFRDQRLRP
jgi:hypothetical protein